jgi:alpha-mannosidase
VSEFALTGAERCPVRVQASRVGEVPASWRQVVEDVVVGSGSLFQLVAGPEAVRLARGESGRLSVRVASAVEAAVAVEAALVSPWGTWEMVGPRAVGAELPAMGEVELGFDVRVPRSAAPGCWWALVRVVGGGRVLYSPAVALEVTL